MKTFLIISCLILSFTVNASNFIPVKSVENSSLAGYSLLEECQRNSPANDICADIGDNPISTYEVYSYEIDDLTKPTYSKSGVVSCSNLEDCEEKNRELNCPNSSFPVMRLDILEAYCATASGYEKKEVRSIRQSASLLASYQTAKAIKDAEDLQESKIQGKLKLIDAGKRVIALFNLRNEAKSLTTQQVTQLLTSFAGIKGLLETGSLVTARGAISSVTADGVLVTEDDKTALIAELDKFIVVP